MTAIEKIAQAKIYFQGSDFKAFWGVMSKFYESHNTAYYRDILVLKFLWRYYKRQYKSKNIENTVSGRQFWNYLLAKTKLFLDNIEAEQESLPTENLAEILAQLAEINTNMTMSNFKQAKLLFRALFSQMHSRYEEVYLNNPYPKRVKFDESNLLNMSRMTDLYLKIMSKIETEKKMVLAEDFQTAFLKKKELIETIAAFNTNDILMGFWAVENAYNAQNKQSDKLSSELIQVVILNQRMNFLLKRFQNNEMGESDYIQSLEKCFEKGFDILEGSPTILYFETEMLENEEVIYPNTSLFVDSVDDFELPKRRTSSHKKVKNGVESSNSIFEKIKNWFCGLGNE
jgi:hypothetical protein